MRTVRLAPQLSIAALKSNLEKEISTWYCLRALNYWGSGRLDLADAVRGLILVFGYSQSAAYRILKSGDGTFWIKQRSPLTKDIVVRIYGLPRVAEYLRSPSSPYFVEIPIPKFVGDGNNRIQRQRAWLYSVFHKPEGLLATPISRAAIEEATGVNRRSQQRYDKIAIRRVANFANKQDDRRKMIPAPDTVKGKNREWVVHKRLGNTYHSRATKGARGLLRNVKTACQQSLNRGEACLAKRFFPSEKSFNKCRHHHEDPFILVRPAERLIPGRVEWLTI
jgi:hypothetical protein